MEEEIAKLMKIFMENEGKNLHLAVIYKPATSNTTMRRFLLAESSLDVPVFITAP